MWKRIYDGDSDGSRATLNRLFIKGGRLYPRISIWVYDGFPIDGEGVLVGVSKKETPEGYWEQCNIPKELILEFIEMLKEIK